MSLTQIATRTGLSAATLAAEVGAIAPFTTTDLVLVACALGRELVEFLPGASAEGGAA
ncbi:hypothetical protein VMT65_22515 [Nocardia sp. CDC153]|uniref:hypothetical protein n=1 Tax=Nocardia sp. CDC153 TaxID=3112167 RepID=UPI002DBA5365|nr:hypothetical protein [Nocardia sp. CDC153]MEC3955824.1 hypothetical protein [Nocardia sp. CDC153]